jgi:triphosphoribosyl-dephospho-CoA synthase
VTRVDATLAHSGPSGDLLEQQVQLACVLEASAAKPGNITPAHDFPDATYVDMVRSGIALGPVFARPAALRRSVGELIADGVAATRRVVCANTNLGIVLLFAPMVRAAVARAADEPLRAAIGRTLDQLSVADAAAAFSAIARAAPGGLGDAPEHDVRAPAVVTLREAMAAAAHRDSIASEYVTGYAIVFDIALPLLIEALRGGMSTLEAIVSLHVGLLAYQPDSLIARKAGAAAARAVTEAAREVRDGTRRLEDLDRLLRREGGRLNPGTTADLVAATVLAGLLTGTRLP